MTIYVTDHAVLRYIERIHGVNVELLRDELRQMALRGAQAAESVGGGEYTIKTERFRMRVVGANVVTVYPTAERR